MRRNKSLLNYLKGDFRDKLCEEKGESKNIRVVNRLEIGVSLILTGTVWTIKNYDFWWVYISMSYLSNSF